MSMNRREFVKLLGAAAGSSALAGCAGTTAPARPVGRVIVIGGGFGGAAAAKYIRMWSGGTIEVFLVERNSEFISCPQSNLVLSGVKTIANLTRGYGKLREHGVQVLRDEVTGIDLAKKRIQLKRIQDLPYDRLVLSPGIDFMYDEIAGYNAEAQKTILHAWKAGPETLALRKQLEEMRNGGVYVLSVPMLPYRCTPGPYERMSQVAFYLKKAKPRSKIIALDANPDITSKGPLFRAAWKQLYGDLIEYRKDAKVTRVDARAKSVSTDFDTVRGDVLNVVPPHRAGDIAKSAGLITSNNRWCDIDWLTMQSKVNPFVHILGDATLSAPGMPKSGHMANQHAKICADSVVALMTGRAINDEPMISNTCYSWLNDREAIHVASVHKYDKEKKTLVPVPGSGGVSAAALAPANVKEGAFADAWAQSIWDDMLT